MHSVIHVSPAARRILRARSNRPMRRPKYDGIDIVETIMQILRGMAKRLDAVIESLGGQSDQSEDIDPAGRAAASRHRQRIARCED